MTIYFRNHRHHNIFPHFLQTFGLLEIKCSWRSQIFYLRKQTKPPLEFKSQIILTRRCAPNFFTEVTFSDVEVVHILFQQYCVNGGVALHIVDLNVLV